MQLQKVESFGSYVFTVLNGIPSDDSYVIFTGVVYMMAFKCMINGGTMAPNAGLSWPKLLKIVCLGHIF